MKKFLYTVFMYGACYGAMFEGFATVQNVELKMEIVYFSNREELQPMVEGAFGVKLEESDKQFLEYFGYGVKKIGDKAKVIGNKSNTTFGPKHYFKDTSLFVRREKQCIEKLLKDEITKGSFGIINENVNCESLDEESKNNVNRIVDELKYNDFIKTIADKIIKDISEDFKTKIDAKNLKKIGQKMGEEIVDEVEREVNNKTINANIKNVAAQKIREYLSNEISHRVAENAAKKNIEKAEKGEKFKLLTPISVTEKERLLPLLKRARATVKFLYEAGYERHEIEETIDKIYSPLPIRYYTELDIPLGYKAIDLKNFGTTLTNISGENERYKAEEVRAITFQNYMDAVADLGKISDDKKKEYWRFLLDSSKTTLDEFVERFKTMLEMMQYKKKVYLGEYLVDYKMCLGGTHILLSLSDTKKKEYIDNILAHVKAAASNLEAMKVLVLFLARNENFVEEKTVFVQSDEPYPFVYFGGKMTNVFYEDNDETATERFKSYTIHASDNFKKDGIIDEDKITPVKKDIEEKWWLLIHEFRHVILGTLIGYRPPSVYETVDAYFQNAFIKELCIPSFAEKLKEEYEKLQKNLNQWLEESGNNAQDKYFLKAIEYAFLAPLHFSGIVGYKTDENKLRIIGEEEPYEAQEFAKKYSKFLSNVWLLKDIFGWYPEIEELRNVTGILFLNNTLYVDDLNDHNLFCRWFYSIPFFDDTFKNDPFWKDFKINISPEEKKRAYEVFSKAFSHYLYLKNEIKNIDKIQQEKKRTELGLSSN